jgi:hypothetical protein
MTFFNRIEQIIRRQSSPPALLAIDDDRLLGGWEEGVEPFFQPQESYFEIRLKQIYLRNQREYWREFLPLATFVASFIHDDQLRDLPFVVGPERLGERAAALGGDAVEYRNLRLAGPFPYEGGDLRLFAALSRLTVNNWAAQTLSLLEGVAKAFDPSKVTRYLEIAAPLAKGVEAFLGMQDVELRLAVDQTYQRTVGRSGLRANSLRARYDLLLNRPEDSLDAAARRQLWVKEGRLFHGETAASAQPYREADFLLLEIRPLRERDDYVTFDFHKRNWQETQKAIWDGGEELAWQKLKLTAAALVQCRDIVRPQRIALLHTYRKKFDEELALYQQLMLGPVHRSTREIQAKAAEQASAFTNAALLNALRSGPAADRELTPEQAMANLGL